MNTVKVFAEGVAKQIHDYLPAEYGNVRCEIQENLKNNGVRLVGIEFHKPDSTVSPLPDGMYVLTNEQKTYGASLLAVPGIMEKVNQFFPEGYYILPSSLHETIILPKPCGVSAKELGEMVRDINRTQVNREERLSDCVYEYDKEKSVIRQVPESVRRREVER